MAIYLTSVKPDFGSEIYWQQNREKKFRLRAIGYLNFWDRKQFLMRDQSVRCTRSEVIRDCFKILFLSSLEVAVAHCSTVGEK